VLAGDLAKLLSLFELQASSRKDWCAPVRNIEIGRQDGETHPYVAIDHGANLVMFRHDDLLQLRTLCQKLRWNVVRDTAAEYNGPAA
jgi:hypothetical protein